MELRKRILRYANQQLELHKLTSKGWKFRWGKYKIHFGLCEYPRRRISVSWPVAQVNPWSEIKDTVLHEIAHALQYERTGNSDHEKGWQRIGKRLGCKVEGWNYKGVTPRYVYQCQYCQTSWTYHYRLPKKFFCGKCAEGKDYPQKYKLTLFKIRPLKMSRTTTK